MLHAGAMVRTMEALHDLPSTSGNIPTSTKPGVYPSIEEGCIKTDISQGVSIWGLQAFILVTQMK